MSMGTFCFVESRCAIILPEDQKRKIKTVGILILDMFIVEELIISGMVKLAIK